jgi:TRAP-type transport system periplasmic protein
MVSWKKLFCNMVILVGLSLLIGFPAQAAEEIIIKFTDTHPLTHTISIYAHQPFQKRVEELTNGKVKFKHFPAEQLGKEKDFIDLCRQGIADMIYSGAGQQSGKMPLHGGCDLAGLGADCVRNSKAYQTLLHKTDSLVFEEFQRNGLRPIMGFLFPPYQILLGSKPVRKISDLKGLKIRINSPVMGNAIEALGGTPAMLTSPEVFEGLQRGTVDGTTFTYISGKSWKLEEVIKFGTVGIDVGTVGSFWAMNDNFWKKLPDDVKAAIDKASYEISASLSKQLVTEESSIIADWEKKGKDLYHLTPADQKEWGEKVKPAIEKWITTEESRGRPGRKAYEQMMQVVAEVK